MSKDDIHIDDIGRILFGAAPPEFLIEVFLRTVIIYTGTLVITKLLGKRMKAQLTITEMAVMIMMGAVISLPMQAPDRGVFQGFTIMLVLTGLHFYFNLRTLRSKKFEQLTQGKMTVLVKDGVLQLKEMSQSKISREQLFAELRSKEIFNLGKVERVYIEDCGTFSIYKEEKAKTGLSILPRKGKPVMLLPTAEDVYACERCGTTINAGAQQCDNCGSNKLNYAVNG
jgi:uncharacterized membrane protein YcaP (DUF421 family)